MTSCRRLGHFCAWLSMVALCGSSSAHADTPPNAWDVAKDPAAAERWALHVRVDRLLHSTVVDETGLALEDRRDRELHAEAALAMLEQAGAATSPDVLLQFDLGLVLFELAELQGRADLYDKAAKTLSEAVDRAPEGPAASLALERVAYAYAKLNRPRDELRAWRRHIPMLIDPRSRAVSQMNMGEAEMRMGLIDDALETLREVLRACGEIPNTSSTYVLALWDLAVALDRSGDARGALEAASKASRQTAISSRGTPLSGRELLSEDPAVFFVPAWEKDWYLALAYEVQGQKDSDPGDAAGHLAEAEQQWDEYIHAATGASAAAQDESVRSAAERWLQIARLRRQRLHGERTAADKRVQSAQKRAGPRSPAGDD